MSSTSRSLQHSWNTAWTTAPPPSCTTLRNLANTVAWGETCVFAEEDGDPLPPSINTACMPWVTSNIVPSPSAFYSPATACPSSWTAVATSTAGLPQWVDGETALLCCPDAFEGDGGTGCRPRGNGNFVVNECGEADAEENQIMTYAGAMWPASATARVDALQLRWQASDTGGTASATSGGPTASGSSGGGGGNGSGSNSGGSGDGLSTGAIAAIATVIPLVFIIGALAAFMLWRRKKNRDAAAAAAKSSLGDEKSGRNSGIDGAAHPQSYHFVPTHKAAHVEPTSHGTAAAAATANPAPSPAVAAAIANSSSPSQYETPEWNAELDAAEAERQRLVSPSIAPASAVTDASSQPSELGGIVRMQRKPIPPVEIDSREVAAEVGDAYIPYRPGVHGQS
ncbi:hypothetical protein NX059_009020 [Plenodomus lindquistii]|nr:hypothetical protein NX059_009020 [Plenodomus lindquistii]